MRCRCIRRSSRRTAGTSASSKSVPTASLRSVSRAAAGAFRGDAARAACRLSPDGSIYEWRADNIALETRPARAQRRRRADHRLRPRLVRPWRDSAGRRRTCLQPIRCAMPARLDLTAHVDFEALGQRAESIGARIHGPIAQRDCLRRLGIDQRAAALKTHAPTARRSRSTRRCRGLTAAEPREWASCSRSLAIVRPAARSAAGIRERHDGQGGDAVAARHPPRLLHARRRRFRRGLCEPQRRHRLATTPPRASPKTARAWRPPSGLSRIVLAHRLPDSLAAGRGRRDAVAADARPRADAHRHTPAAGSPSA